MKAYRPVDWLRNRYVTAGNSLLTQDVCIVYSRVSDVVLRGVVGMGFL